MLGFEGLRPDSEQGVRVRHTRHNGVLRSQTVGLHQVNTHNSLEERKKDALKMKDCSAGNGFTTALLLNENN